jgi:two-component system LytT family response regulator
LAGSPVQVLVPTDPNKAFEIPRVLNGTTLVLTINRDLQSAAEKILQNTKATESKIGIAMADKIVFVNVSDILYCEAKGVYTNIYLYDGKKILASKPLGDFESQLATLKFFRIHHSTLINLNHIKEFQRFNGGYVVMQNDAKLEVSHRKRKDFLEAINDSVV